MVNIQTAFCEKDAVRVWELSSCYCEKKMWFC